MKRHLFRACLTLAFVAYLGTVSVAVHSEEQPKPQPLPSDKELDAFVTAKDWNSLGAALVYAGNSDDALTRKVQWLQSRLDQGGPSFLAFMAIPNTWLLGVRQNVADPEKDLRIRAGLLALYAYELIAIDGAKCKDSTAPGRRAAELLHGNRPVWDYLRAQPHIVKAEIIDKALDYEQQTEPLRKDDDFMCRGGIEEMEASEKADKEHAASGASGQSTSLHTPAEWAPAYLSPEEYKSRQEYAHDRIKEVLQNLLSNPESKR